MEILVKEISGTYSYPILLLCMQMNLGKQLSSCPQMSEYQELLYLGSSNFLHKFITWA